MIWSTGGPDHRVLLQDGHGVATVLGDHGEQVEVLAISRDDRYAVSGGATRLWLYDLKAHTSTELLGHKSDIRFATFTERGLLTADFRYGKIFLWNMQTGTGELVGEHGDMLHQVSVAADPKGRWVATSSRDNQIFLHHLIGEPGTTLLATSEWPVSGMAASADGAYLAMSLRQGEISVFDPLDPVAPILLRSPDMMESLGHPTFSPDNRSLVATNSVTGLRLWKDWKRSDESLLLRARHESWFPIFSPDGKRIVAPGKPQGSASIWHIATRQRRDLQGHEVTGRAGFWPASQAIVVSSWNGVVNIWSDDLPIPWSGLKSWIDGQIARHAMPVR
jgi:WD40 repeat protein